jgi:dihydrodipicolinate reductase
MAELAASTEADQAAQEARRMVRLGCRAIFVNSTSASFDAVREATTGSGALVVHSVINEGGRHDPTAIRFGERPRAQVGLHALRVGDNPGEHTAVFGLMGETLELSHRALNRDGFARGALDAAKFLAGKPPGLYTMSDLLG